MKLWSAFFRAIVTELGDCPTFTMEDAIKRAAQDFYRDTRAWRVEGVTLATTVIGQRAYTVTTNPTDADLVGLPAVWIGDDEVQEAAPGESDDVSSTYTDQTWRVRVTGAAAISLTPGPTEAGQIIKATAAYAPADSATGLDDGLYAEHRRAIEHAALAILLLQKARPWYDPNLSEYHARAGKVAALRFSSMAGPSRRHPLRSRPA